MAPLKLCFVLSRRRLGRENSSIPTTSQPALPVLDWTSPTGAPRRRERMCWAQECGTCQKTSWAGCGRYRSLFFILCDRSKTLFPPQTPSVRAEHGHNGTTWCPVSRGMTTMLSIPWLACLQRVLQYIVSPKFMITTPAKLQTYHVGAGGRRHGAPLPGLGGEPDATRSRAYPHLHPLRVPISLLRGRLLPRANRNGRRACWVFYALPGSKFFYPIGVSSRVPSACLGGRS